MTLHLAGWVECKNPTSAIPDWWMPVIYVTPIVANPRPRTPSTIFLPGADPTLRPPGMEQGFPDDLSPFVRRWAEEDAERNDLGVLIDSENWVTWADLKSFAEQPDWTDDWRLVFSLLEPLAAVCGDEHVRLVVWVTS